MLNGVCAQSCYSVEARERFPVSDRPLTQERQRCFECGISYPPDAPECEVDHARLWPETIHHVWRIEGVIAPRPGGATCAAYHLHTGERVAIDVVRSLDADHPDHGVSAAGHHLDVQPVRAADDGAVRLLQAEAQALHMLDQPNLLRLFETGIDEHGIAYMVTELGTARPLGDLIEEWQRSGQWPIGGRAAGQIGRQLLTVLVAAHRAGQAHQGLASHHVFLLHEDEILAGRARSGAVRLRGLRTLSLGQTIRGSIRGDLRAVAALLYELLVGEPPSGERASLRERTIPSGVEPALWEVVIRGLGENSRDAFASADEMLRALAVAVPPIASEVSAAALATLGRTDPGAEHSATEEIPVEAAQAAAASEDGAQLAQATTVSRMSGQMASLPAPPQGFVQEPPARSSISGELQAVSFRDLFESEQGPRRVETLAQSRRRVSAASLKIPALPMPPEFSVPPAVMAPNSHPAISQLGTSGEHASLEPTADLSALPIADFASQSSGRISVQPHEVDRMPRAEPHAIEPTAAGDERPEAPQAGPFTEQVAVPQAIDPYAATGQVVGPEKKPASDGADRAAVRLSGPRLMPPGAIVLPAASKSSGDSLRRVSTSKDQGAGTDPLTRQSGERPAPLSTSAELDAQHDRRFTWAIAVAAVVVLISLWLLLH